MNQKKNQEPPKLKLFIVEVEGLIPAKTQFKVMAEDEDHAWDIFDKTPHMVIPMGPPKPVPNSKIKKTKVSIRNAISTLITWIKTF